MAAVNVTIVNNSGKTLAIRLDDQVDADEIEYLRKRVRRDELADVKVEPAEKPSAAKRTTKAAADADA